jgi:hypothetical protein
MAMSTRISAGQVRLIHDDAVAESFVGSLKKRRIQEQTYKNRELSIADVADYIEAFSPLNLGNSTARASSIGSASNRAEAE